MGINDDKVTMSEATLRNIIHAMDHNKDGIVHKHEFIAAYSTVYTGYTAKEYQAVWAAIDRDKNGELSLDELAAYYGYSLDDLAEEEMSDETILELLEMQTKLAELAMEKEKKLNPPKMPSTKEPSRRGSRLSSRGLGGSVRGSEEVRKSAGVTLVKLASPINASAAAADPTVVFLQACEFSERRCSSPRPKSPRRRAHPKLATRHNSWPTPYAPGAVLRGLPGNPAWHMHNGPKSALMRPFEHKPVRSV